MPVDQAFGMPFERETACWRESRGETGGNLLLQGVLVKTVRDRLFGKMKFPDRVGLGWGFRRVFCKIVQGP